ncbi:MAG: carotenoid biosynthesis protein [Ferruginibacter sp.]
MTIKEKIATGIAVVFHLIGLCGMFFYDVNQFASLSWINLVLMAVLIFYVQEKIKPGLIIFFVACYITGMLTEIAGTSTGMFFGDYSYTPVLGTSFKNVPLVIGVNWFIIIYCVSVSMYMLATNIHKKTDKVSPEWLKAMTIITDSALLAVALDWLLEPAAIKLNFWNWAAGIPVYNYVSWFVISAALAAVFYFAVGEKANKFAVNLLLIQAMFFLVIRTFL